MDNLINMPEYIKTVQQDSHVFNSLSYEKRESVEAIDKKIASAGLSNLKEFDYSIGAKYRCRAPFTSYPMADDSHVNTA